MTLAATVWGARGRHVTNPNKSPSSWSLKPTTLSRKEAVWLRDSPKTQALAELKLCTCYKCEPNFSLKESRLLMKPGDDAWSSDMWWGYHETMCDHNAHRGPGITTQARRPFTFVSSQPHGQLVLCHFGLSRAAFWNLNDQLSFLFSRKFLKTEWSSITHTHTLSGTDI